MSEAPIGTVTLVFTDVESSCTLWEELPDAMREALWVHDALLRRLLADHGGYEVKTEGDAFMVSFGRASDALAFCLDVQGSLRDLEWPSGIAARGGLRVRMGAHEGRPHCEPNPVTGRMDYLGTTVNRAARIAALAAGGQILACRQTVGAAGPLDGAGLHSHGERPLKGLSEPVELIEVLPSWRPGSLGPPRAPANAAPPGPGGWARDLGALLPAAAEGLLARGRVHALRADPAAGADLGLARDVAAAAGRDDLVRRADLARFSFEMDLELRDVFGDLQGLHRDAARAGDRYVEARSLVAVARLRIERMQGLEEVEGELERALELAERLGDPDIEATALLQRGLLERRTNRTERCLETLERALDLVEMAGSRRLLGPILNGLSSIRTVLGDPDAALAARACEEARRSGSAVDLAWAVHHQGVHRLLAGRAGEGLDSLREARAAFEGLGHASGVWRTDLMIAIALASLRRMEEAEATIGSCAASGAGLTADGLVRGALTFHRAWVRLAAGRLEEARDDAVAALEAFGEAPGHPLARASARLLEVLAGTTPAPPPPGDLTGTLFRVIFAGGDLERTFPGDVRRGGGP